MTFPLSGLCPGLQTPSCLYSVMLSDWPVPPEQPPSYSRARAHTRPVSQTPYIQVYVLALIFLAANFLSPLTKGL